MRESTRYACTFDAVKPKWCSGRLLHPIQFAFQKQDLRTFIDSDNLLTKLIGDFHPYTPVLIREKSGLQKKKASRNAFHGYDNFTAGFDIGHNLGLDNPVNSARNCNEKIKSVVKFPGREEV
jgi:hypothetical protein